VVAVSIPRPRRKGFSGEGSRLACSHRRTPRLLIDFNFTWVRGGIRRSHTTSLRPQLQRLLLLVVSDGAQRTVSEDLQLRQLLLSYS